MGGRARQRGSETETSSKTGAAVPEIGREEYRELIYGNYRVVYRISGTMISILTVRHYSRLFDPAELKKSESEERA